MPTLRVGRLPIQSASNNKLLKQLPGKLDEEGQAAQTSSRSTVPPFIKSETKTNPQTKLDVAVFQTPGLGCQRGGIVEFVYANCWLHQYFLGNLLPKIIKQGGGMVKQTGGYCRNMRITMLRRIVPRILTITIVASGKKMV